jgi:hypothetical protein
MRTQLFWILALLGLLQQPIAAQPTATQATQTATRTLAETIAQALEHSAAGQQVVTNRETGYWAWRAHCLISAA